MALVFPSSAMETAFPEFKVKSESRFLQALFMLVVTLAVAMGSQSAPAQTAPCTLTDIDRDDDGLIEICDLEGLNAIRYRLDGTGYKASVSATKITAGCPATGCKGYELTRDLDFNDADSYSSTSNRVIWTMGDGWQPIGSYYNALKATFNGNGYTISNLMINRPRLYSVGLFGSVKEAFNIVNVGLPNVNVTGNLYVGGLIGENNGVITNSYATGSVTGTYQVGGLVGSSRGGSITNSYAASSVTGIGWSTEIGGLVGSNSREGNITNSYATGSVTGTMRLGGLVGENNSGIIMNSYATGSVIGIASFVGGLIGYNRGSIKNSYATGSVAGSWMVGGLIGRNRDSIENSYATGSVISNGSYVGGLIGYNSGSIKNSYWDKQTSRRTTSAGGAGKTTAQLQSPITATGIYRSWSTDVWHFGTTTQYPALKYSDGTVMPNQGRVLPEDVPLEIIADSTSCGATDIDQDDDGLIEICDLERLNAIRYQLDGTGYKVSKSEAKITAGCPATGCRGYELVRDLDFNELSSYSSTSNKVVWTTGAGWEPIGNSYIPFNAIFKANKYSISNLMINRPSARKIGLFGGIGDSARIEGVGLINVNVRGSWGIGSLAGVSKGGGVISNSYATGTIRGGDSAGGLVGDNYGTIMNSYTNISLSGDDYIGGIVGCNFSGGTITNSYTVPRISRSGSSTGGILGYDGAGGSSVLSSYWDMDVSGITNGASGLGRTTAQLQAPTTTIGIYTRWSSATWDFGTTRQYPALKYRDGTVIPNQSREPSEDVPQMPQVEIAGVPTDAVDEGDSITLTASSPSNASDIPLRYRWSQTSGGDLLIEPTTRSSVTIEVPEDYVPADANTVDLSIMLDVISDIGSTAQQVVITIAKRNNGKIAALGAPSLNDKVLTAPAIDLSGDLDGGVGTIGYQWQSRENSQTTRTAWINVSGGTSEAYTIAENVFGTVQYRVVVSYTDGQGYSEEVISEAVVYESRYSLIEIAGLTSCGTTDIDQDNDGLIEICDLEGLNAIRYRLDGTGYKANESAPVITIGCRPNGGCTGYELTRDLDFNDDDSYSSTSNKVVWTTGAGWSPLGHAEYRQYQSSVSTNTTPFNAIFEGNSHTISNLNIDRFLTTNEVGLFGRVGSQARINGVGLINVNVRANWAVGGLVGFNNRGVISNSYVTGSVRGNYGRTGGLVGLNSNGSIANSYAVVLIRGGALGAGGLVGSNHGRITDSYAMGSIEGMSAVGGLVGNSYGGSITNSYATSEVSGSSSIGGLIGLNDDADAITSSYWDRWTSGQMTSAGGEGKTTIQLQSLTAATGIYRSWSTEVWDFGTSEQYPALKYSDGTVMSNQPIGRPDLSHKLGVEITGVPTDAVAEGDQIMLEAFPDYSMSNDIPLRYRWEQTSGKVLWTDSSTLSMIWLEVPGDYVEASANSSDITLILAAISDVGITTQQVVITIAKRNNGQIAALGAPSLNDRVLTAPAIDLSGDPDGGVSTIGYQWQSREGIGTAWVNVPAGTSEAYAIAENVFGTFQYRVIISYTDGQGYSEEIISQAVVYERIDIPFSVVVSTSCSITDIDQDDDGLIEICDLEGLNAIRYQLDGTGYKASESATKITASCPATGCKGYELTRDLDFNDVNSYSSTSNKIIWTTGAGWEPIGTLDNPFNAIFKANKYSISNLMINRPSGNDIGLFKKIGGSARIEGVGLINVNVRGNWGIGSLAGTSSGGGVISNSYATGTIRGGDSAGGLVGDNYGTIINSYTNISMSGDYYIGGIVGCNFYGGAITNSYTVPIISRSVSSAGGILGYNGAGGGSVLSSYWDMDISGITSGAYGLGQTTAQLQAPTTTTGIYTRWSSDTWDFGTSAQYPALKYRDGTVIPNQGREPSENVPQMLQVEIAGVPTDAVDEGDSIILTASSPSNASNIPLNYRWSQISDGDLLIEPTTLSSVTIEVPEDYVSADANTVNLAIMLDVISDVGSTAQQVVITIARRNNGKIAALGAPSLNDRVLTAPAIDLSSDPDGGVSTIGYQWQSRESIGTAWANVVDGMSEAYTAPKYTGGVVQYRVIVSYTDGQGYSEEIASDFSAYQGKTNTAPSIEVPSDNSSIGLLSGQTTRVSVVISEVDAEDIVTLEIAEIPTTTGIVLVEPPGILLGADLGATRTAEFELTALQAGSLRLRLTATDDSGTLTASAATVELSIEIEALPLTSCGTTDVDQDDDGLIEICSLEGLNAIRYEINGSGYRESESAIKSTVGCGEGGCRGYELSNDLDFNNDAHYQDIANKSTWTTGAGWKPLSLITRFEGNDNTISNLMINRELENDIGLFGHASGGGTKINGVGLIDVDIGGRRAVGGLVGRMGGGGIVSNSYVTGDVIGHAQTGGLVGSSLHSSISDSYAIADVEAIGTANISSFVGGLVGSLLASRVSGSHAIGSVKGLGRVGGLVGSNIGANGHIINSYAITNVEGSNNSVGGLIGSNNGISGSVVSSYATGKVVGVNVVGGLVGNNERNYTIRDSYSFADVRGNFSVGGLAGVHVGRIINSYAVGRVEGNLGERGIGGLVGVKSEDATITASYWDKTTSEKAQSDGGEGKTTALLQSPTTATGIYSSWNPGVWDFGTATQYPALKSGDGTPMPDQRIGLSGLSVLTSEEIPYLFNTEVFNYRLMIANEADMIKLLPTATPGVTNIGITSDNGFSESVLSGNQSSPISLAASGMTIVTIQVEFASQASRTYRFTISRAEQSVAVQLVGMNQPFEYVIPRNTVRGRSGDSMQGYTVMRMPSWLDYAESESGLMFSGTPEADYLEDSLEEMLEVKINNVDGTTQIVCLILQIDSPTTGTTVLEELPDGVLQLNDRLSDDNGIEEKTHVWEHCPVGSDAFSELDGVDGMRYTLPEGPNSAPGTAYRVRTTIIDGLGRRSEHTTQIELQGQVTEESQIPISDEAPQRGIRIRAKVFLEGFLQ